MSVEVKITRTGIYTRLIDNTAKLNTVPSALNEDPNRYGALKEHLDLRKGSRGFKDEGAGDLFYSFFDYIKKTSKQGESLEKVINADFVSNRRNLMIIAGSPFSTSKGYEVIRALRKKGIIFLCNKKQENDRPYDDG